MRRFFALLTILFLSACTTTREHTFSGAFTPPPPNSLILIVEPDIQLAIMTAGGTQEPREDWSAAARANIAASIAAHLAVQGHATQAFDPAAAMQGRTGQLIRLHEAVGASILNFNYGIYALPTKQNNFDWTLGPGVSEIAAQTNARYALFSFARGSYASGGRVAAAIGLAILGVGVPLGGQSIFVSLVDLQSGDILWFNVANAGPDADMRERPGADFLVTSLMRTSPLETARPTASRRRQ